MFALSTAWNADRWQDGEAIAQEIFELGIRHIELNSSLTGQMVEAIFKFSRQKGITITSLHNYCPIPEGLKREEALPDCFSLSSIDEDERKKAVEFTKITIATAKKVSARVVVLHAGRVEIEDKTRALIALYNQGLKNSAEYKETFEGLVLKRGARRADHFAQVLKSLATLHDYALKSGIRLGIENRFYYREIPTLEEFKTIFDTFKSEYMAYWHDVGHAYIHEKLGLMQSGALLDNFKDRLTGMHLHNIKKLEDHKAPIDGDFDFRSLSPYVKHSTLKVIEAHSNASGEAVNKSIAALTEVFHD